MTDIRVIELICASVIYKGRDRKGMNMLSAARLRRKVMSNLKNLIILATLLFFVGEIRSLARSGNDEYLPAPQGLKVDGLPPIPLQLVEKAGRYTYSRAAVLQSWHPNRRECLITTRFAETTQAHRVAVPGGDRHQLTFFKDRVLSAAFHPVDGRSVVLLKDKDGDERDQLYRLDVNSNEIMQLTFDKYPVIKPVWADSLDAGDGRIRLQRHGLQRQTWH